MVRLFGIIVLVSIALPGYAFRCGTHLVDKGDHYGEVLEKCGKPTFEEKWVEARYIHVRPHPLLLPELTAGSVLIQLWTYNRGSSQFMRQLRFENGILRRIETLDYGY
jgi:hypothetical protein